MVMQKGRWEIIPGVSTETVGFNGPYLGPTIRLENGRNATLRYANQWSEAVAVHGHGLHVPGIVDGGPQRLIAPGDSWSPVLPIRQRAGTSWYHPHTHGRSGSQTYQGLAGMIIIEDENSRDLPLPRTYGFDDLPVIVQDRTLNETGQFVYSLHGVDRDGFLGEIITVNGIAAAETRVPAGLVRLRLLNASNARFYRFRFSDARTFHKIATEGGFLPEPVPIRELVMLPGERNEIVVDFADGQPANLVSASRPDREREPNGLDEDFEILALRPDPSLQALATELPRRLNETSEATGTLGLPHRRFKLFMQPRFDERGRSNRDQFEPTDHSLHTSMTINRQPMDMHVINERVRLGQWELWEVEADRKIHPFHVHGCSFRVLSQEGRPVNDADAGWKDTVWVSDEGSTTFAVRFDHPATDEYPYMYHCHILEHEDMGMMGQFTVT